jgi:hypothetical protein
MLMTLWQKLMLQVGELEVQQDQRINSMYPLHQVLDNTLRILLCQVLSSIWVKNLMETETKPQVPASTNPMYKLHSTKVLVSRIFHTLFNL